MKKFNEILEEGYEDSKKLKNLASKNVKNMSNTEQNDFIKHAEKYDNNKLDKEIKSLLQIRGIQKRKWNDNPQFMWQLNYLQTLRKTK